MAPTNALRLVLLCFGRVIVIAGVLLLVSGLSVVSCALTIASGVLWMGAATNDDSFASARARLARAPRGCCPHGVDALRGIAIAGIVISVLEMLGVIMWGLSVMWYGGGILIRDDDNYGQIHWHLDYFRLWVFHLPGHALAAGIANIAVQAASLGFIRALNDDALDGGAPGGSGSYDVPLNPLPSTANGYVPPPPVVLPPPPPPPPPRRPLAFDIQAPKYVATD